jgi:hypothetical protein
MYKFRELNSNELGDLKSSHVAEEGGVNSIFKLLKLNYFM